MTANGDYMNSAPIVAEVMSGVIASRQAANRLGIPLINVADSVNGVTLLNTTLFPASLSMASTWNLPLFSEVIDAISIENRAVGVHWVFSPELDLAREPRYGRVGETYGEDPYLVSRFGVTYVKAMQALDGQGFARVATTIKHFIYGSSTGGINQASMVGGVNDFWNTYAKPFVAVLSEAAPFALMPSYAAFDRVPMHANTHYNLDILRDTLGFDGVVSSDYAGISDLYQWHHVAADITSAGLLSLQAGVGHEIGDPSLTGFGSLGSYGNDSEVEALVTEAARRMLTLKMKTRTFEQPFPDLNALNSSLRTTRHEALNLNISKESMVLLKNAEQILPLNESALSSVAVIGPFATVINAGSYAADDFITGGTILRGIQSIAKNVTYSQGCYRSNYSNYDTMKMEAVAAAKAAKVAIVALGSSSSNFDDNLLDRTDGEAYDHADLDFPGPQVDLLQAIVETGTPVILVISGGQAFTMEYAATNANAIIHTFLQGEMGGYALASILGGATNPSAKLPVSIPRASSQVPIYYNYLPSDREQKFSMVLTDWEWPATNRTPRYPFGYGLSYTTFEVSNVNAIKIGVAGTHGSILVTASLMNTGKQTGQEVLQVYFAQQTSMIERPVKNLVRFDKIKVEAGQSQNLTFEIPIHELGYYVNGEFRVDGGNYTMFVGTSSSDMDLTKVVVNV